jgi:hypothetical protein
MVVAVGRLCSVILEGYRFDMIHTVHVLTISNVPTNAIIIKIKFMYKY